MVVLGTPLLPSGFTSVSFCEISYSPFSEDPWSSDSQLLCVSETVPLLSSLLNKTAACGIPGGHLFLSMLWRYSFPISNYPLLADEKSAVRTVFTNDILCWIAFEFLLILNVWSVIMIAQGWDLFSFILLTIQPDDSWVSFWQILSHDLFKGCFSTFYFLPLELFSACWCLSFNVEQLVFSPSCP